MLRTLAVACLALAGGLAATPSPVCGNGTVEAGEQCDDGNTTGGDGCSATCASEAPVCGNGRVESGEECDDGNRTSRDGCSSTCKFEQIPALCDAGYVEVSVPCKESDEEDALGGCGVVCLIAVR